MISLSFDNFDRRIFMSFFLYPELSFYGWVQSLSNALIFVSQYEVNSRTFFNLPSLIQISGIKTIKNVETNVVQVRGETNLMHPFRSLFKKPTNTTANTQTIHKNHPLRSYVWYTSHFQKENLYGLCTIRYRKHSQQVH